MKIVLLALCVILAPCLLVQAQAPWGHHTPTPAISVSASEGKPDRLSLQTSQKMTKPKRKKAIQVTAPPGSRLSYSSIPVSGLFIALTFDDGPSAANTPKLLDLLKAKGVRATFFLVGQNVAAYPDLVKRMVAEGHEVGNHSWSHPPLVRCGTERLRRELEDTNAAIERATGLRPTLLRPPYGATSKSLNQVINEQFKMKVILWSIDPLDWKYRNSQRVAQFILKETKPGDIILSHDIHATTVAAMPQVIDGFLARGFQFVTVSQLIAMEQPPRKPSPTPHAASPIPSPPLPFSPLHLLPPKQQRSLLHPTDPLFPDLPLTPIPTCSSPLQ